MLRILSNATGNVFQKKLTASGNNPLAVNFLTYFLLSIGCLPIAISVNWRVLPDSFWYYSVLGGIVGALGNGFLVRALQKGDLSVLAPINSYKSVVSILIGIFLLGEVPNGWGLLGIMLIIYGSYFVLDTTEERFSRALLKKPEIQFRLWAMVLTAVEAVFVKKVVLASSTTIAFISWCWFGAVFSGLLLFVYRLDMKSELSKISQTDLIQYAFLIACVGTMQFTTNYVFDRMPVGYALSLFQLSAIVSVLLGYRLFNEQAIRQKLIGSALMIAGSVVIILLKNV
ncbi:EamA family transporter [Spirosoma luteum]|uniref:EamA family transporter n=1 Tax=Spirosoma luteum TaxID=431553 RepID=UPI001FE05CC6|nr:EamA family transporter [Spirosoma luteum]